MALEPRTKRGATEDAVVEPKIFDRMVGELRDPSIVALDRNVRPDDFYALWLANFKVYKLAKSMDHYEDGRQSVKKERAKRFIKFCKRTLDVEGTYVLCVWRQLMLSNYPVKQLQTEEVLAKDDETATTNWERSARRRWRLLLCIAAAKSLDGPGAGNFFCVGQNPMT